MNKLTENAIRKAEIREKQYKIYDGGGMFLLIHPNGSKYWRMKFSFDGKSKLASFGVWPDVSLMQARERRNEARQKINMGINPINEKRKNKQHLRERYSDDDSNEFLKETVSASRYSHWYNLLSSQAKVRGAEGSLQFLRSSIFYSTDRKPLSVLDKEELNEILGNIIRNRRDLLKIFWEFYLSFPIINILVLFLLLTIVMDFFPALLTTMLYFILTLFAAAALCLCEEKKVFD